MIKIPLSQSGPADQFAAAVASHAAALEAHRMGPPGIPAPVAHELVEAAITRVQQAGPVDDRGPDQFVILPYEIVDDRPVSPEVQILRDSINSGHSAGN
jgi:hypothetical protein